ncbi:MAG: hypothetical protein IJV07_05530 [Alphaproteobacteria bacterium]|nr:hypothetical protein [Alphaproteobacteria bacterium]
MSFLDRLKQMVRRHEQMSRFREQNKILDKVDARTTEYTEYHENGQLLDRNVYIDGESVTNSLEAKEKYLAGASADARKKREKAVSKAESKNRPLSEEEVMSLRNAEEKKRFEAAKKIADMKRQH